MKMAIVGSRKFKNYPLLRVSLEAVMSKMGIPEKIISGGAKGADRLAMQFAGEAAIGTEVFMPDWELYGPSAGPRRNILIAENADVVVAFWDYKSKGTRHTIEQALERSKKVIIVHTTTGEMREFLGNSKLF